MMVFAFEGMADMLKNTCTTKTSRCKTLRHCKTTPEKFISFLATDRLQLRRYRKGE